MSVAASVLQGAPTTKGCGLVTMGSNDEAAAAIDALDNKHIWEGMEAPMVVKWMDAALQKRRREEHLAAMRQGLVPSMGECHGCMRWAGNVLEQLEPCHAIVLHWLVVLCMLHVWLGFVVDLTSGRGKRADLWRTSCDLCLDIHKQQHGGLATVMHQPH